MSRPSDRRPLPLDRRGPPRWAEPDPVDGPLQVNASINQRIMIEAVCMMTGETVDTLIQRLVLEESRRLTGDHAPARHHPSNDDAVVARAVAMVRTARLLDRAMRSTEADRIRAGARFLAMSSEVEWATIIRLAFEPSGD